MTSDLNLQEPAEAVLERMMNLAPDSQWTDKESRMQRVITFMEMRHFLSLARSYGETDLAKRVTEQNRFLIRLTNMIRGTDGGKNAPPATTYKDAPPRATYVSVGATIKSPWGDTASTS